MSPKVYDSLPFYIFSIVIAILLLITHRKNIKRLLDGTESKTYIWRPRKVRILNEEKNKTQENQKTK